MVTPLGRLRRHLPRARGRKGGTLLWISSPVYGGGAEPGFEPGEAERGLPQC